jgi:hypothetical protein
VADGQVILNATLPQAATTIEAAWSQGQRQARLTAKAPARSLTLLASVVESAADAGSGVADASRQAVEVASWATAGHVEFELTAAIDPGRPLAPHVAMSLSSLSFDSPGGEYAAEGLDLRLKGALSIDGVLLAAVDIDVTAGELLLGDFYRDFGDAALAIHMQPRLEEGVLSVGAIRVSDGSSLQLSAEVEPFEPGGEHLPHLDVDSMVAVLPDAYLRYLESMAAKWTLDGLDTRGTVRWSGTVEQDGEGWIPRTRSLSLEGVSVTDAGYGRFGAAGIDAQMDAGGIDLARPDVLHFDSADLLDQSRIDWDSLSFGPIDLGPASVELTSREGGFGIAEPLVLDLLGGRLAIEELGYALTPGKPLDISLHARFEALDMTRLTKTFGWPEFSGSISGTIPGVGYADGVVEVGGALTFDVFGGRIVVDGVRVERAFGVLPSLAADIDAIGLDLESLTGTFEFGRIGGRLDGYVHDLRMLDWRPVSFDAWFGTPPDAKSSQISRQAVNHLTAIGGGGATAALTGPLMRVFNKFSYRRLGLGCLMHDNVCELRGLEDDDVSVLIMEGSGIPKVTIRAFNRRLDWPRLVGELLAVTGDEEIRID